MKKLKLLLLIILLLVCNQLYYLSSLQFKCTNKINEGKDLNIYEIASAYQTHTNLWLFGWIVSPQTAYGCFLKQFKINNPWYTPSIPEDIVIKQAKQELLSHKTTKIKLTWKHYTSNASIFLNGSYISTYNDDGANFFLYEILLDYKPGVIDINGIKLSETVFDYLENKGILSIIKLSKYE